MLSLLSAAVAMQRPAGRDAHAGAERLKAVGDITQGRTAAAERRARYTARTNATGANHPQRKYPARRPCFARGWRAEELTDGHWRHNSNGSKIPLYETPNGEGTVHTSRSARSVFAAKFCHTPQRHFEWEPTTCELQPFDAERFCKFLGAQNILFVGDSLSRLQAISLARLLGGSEYPAPDSKGRRISSCPQSGAPPRTSHTKRVPTEAQPIPLHDIETDVCGGSRPSCLAMRRANYLVTGFGPNITHEHAHWLAQFKVIVLNTGAHYKPPGAWLDEAASLYARHARAGAHVVYRTTVPGHVDIWNNRSLAEGIRTRFKFAGHARFGAPFANLSVAEEWLSENPGPANYNYLKIKAFNNAAVATFVRAFAKRPDVYFSVLDVYSISMMQWADHFDPIHYCLGPGPPDLWNMLLAGMLAPAG